MLLCRDGRHADPDTCMHVPVGSLFWCEHQHASCDCVGIGHERLRGSNKVLNLKLLVVPTPSAQHVSSACLATGLHSSHVLPHSCLGAQYKDQLAKYKQDANDAMDNVKRRDHLEDITIDPKELTHKLGAKK